jgi:hypothetical protein
MSVAGAARHKLMSLGASGELRGGGDVRVGTRTRNRTTRSPICNRSDISS